ncbi:hypothetical protein V1478_013743 [Vespula squamosa]|uniref:Uncharacterized protein n=1 Tax=Vespula squamosa TaxID=30214 RepID=A0ABD2A6C9_VESSQ
MQILIDLRFTQYNFYTYSADTRTLANMISFNSTKLMCKSYNVVICFNDTAILVLTSFNDAKIKQQRI